MNNVIIHLIDGEDVNVSMGAFFEIKQVYDDKNFVSIYCYSKPDQTKPDEITMLPWHRIKEISVY